MDDLPHSHRPIAIRLAEPADLPRLVDFNAAMARETEGRELERSRLEAGTRAVFDQSERGFYVIAEQTAVPVGCLLVTREWSDWRNGWFWWIQSVYVVPDARRHGVYRAMHRWVEDRARRAGDPRDGRPVVGLRLYVETHNERAMATYAALGMLPSHYRIFETDFVLAPPESPAQVRQHHRPGGGTSEPQARNTT